MTHKPIHTLQLCIKLTGSIAYFFSFVTSHSLLGGKVDGRCSMNCPLIGHILVVFVQPLQALREGHLRGVNDTHISYVG